MIDQRKRPKIFLLGVGAQKAGTTWLHTQLSQTPYFNPGFAKEYHIFDVLSVPEMRSMRTSFQRKLKTAVANNALASDGKSSPNFTLKLSFYDSLENYYNYFDYLWHRDADLLAVGDMTPSYSLLSKATFKRLLSGLEKRGFTVKVVFLMRDPYDRIYSQLRMSIRNKKRRGSLGDHALLSAEEQLESYYARSGVYLRTRYDQTIAALESVFMPEDIFYGFYESMFTEPESIRFQNFLGLPEFTPRFGEVRNKSPLLADSPSDSLKQKICSYYSDVYRFVHAKFGEEVSSLWPSFNLL